jgi:hypothetical protein
VVAVKIRRVRRDADVGVGGVALPSASSASAGAHLGLVAGRSPEASLVAPGVELCSEDGPDSELHLGHAPTQSLDRSTVDRPDGAGGTPRPVGPPGDQAATERLETSPDLREVDRIPAPLRIDHSEALLGVGEQEP